MFLGLVGHISKYNDWAANAAAANNGYRGISRGAKSLLEEIEYVMPLSCSTTVRAISTKKIEMPYCPVVCMIILGYHATWRDGF